MEAASQTIYDDSVATGIARAGLRQTDLSTQLENSNKKKYRTKTQSVLYNSNMAKSKSSLYDGMSVNSGGSNDTNNYSMNPMMNNMNMNPMMSNMNNMNNMNPMMNNMNPMMNNMNINQRQMMQRQQMMMMQQQQQQQHQMYNNNNNSNIGFQQNQNYQQGGYYPNNNNNNNNNNNQSNLYSNYNGNVSQNNISLSNQSINGKKDFRESYMYLNQFNSNTNLSINNNNINNINNINNNENFNNNPPANNLQRRFSGQNGGIVGSPMSITNEETARKISFNNLIGANNNNSSYNNSINNDDIMNTIDYMNTLDTPKNLENEWESIDEGIDEEDYEEGDEEDDDEDDDDEEEYDDYNKLSKNELKKILDRIKIENRGLKKKLKDIELGHDASSIVAYDEKYIKLEDEFTDLASKYLIIENEMKNMTIQNESYFKDITKLRNELHESDNNVSKLTSLSRSIIERIPTYIKQKENFLVLLGELDELPDLIKDSYLHSIEKYKENSNNHNNNPEGILTDDNIMDLLKDEVKQLTNALQRSDNLIKQKDKIFNQKIQDERRTIIVSSLQRSLHNEFINEHPKNNKYGLKNFRILKICPGQNNTDIDVDNDDDIGDETAQCDLTEINQHEKISSPLSSSSSPILATSSPTKESNLGSENLTLNLTSNINLNSSSSATTAMSLTPEQLDNKIPYLSPISIPSSTDSSPKKRTTIYSNEDRVSHDDDFRDAFSTISRKTQNSTTTHNSHEIEYETFNN